MFRNIFVSLLIFQVLASDSTPTPGPFKTTMLKIKDCVKLSRPYVKNPAFLFKPSLHNSTKGPMFSGNVTVVRNISNVKVKLKSYTMRNGTLELNYVMNSLDCHGKLIQLIHVATKVKYDSKTCTYFKGSYIFKNLDINAVQHIWMKTTEEYGLMMWRVEATVQAGTLFCHVFDTLVEPV